MHLQPFEMGNGFAGIRLATEWMRMQLDSVMLTERSTKVVENDT